MRTARLRIVPGEGGGVVTWSRGGGGGEVLSPGPGGAEGGVVTWSRGGGVL